MTNLKDKMICWFPLNENGGTRRDIHNRHFMDVELGGGSIPSLHNTSMILDGKHTLSTTDTRLVEALQINEDDFTLALSVFPFASTPQNKILYYLGGGSASSPGLMVYNRNQGVSHRLAAYKNSSGGENTIGLTPLRPHTIVIRIDRDAQTETIIDKTSITSVNTVRELPNIYNSYETVSLAAKVGSLAPYAGLMWDFRAWNRKITDREIAHL